MANKVACDKYTMQRTLALLQAAAANCEDNVAWELREAMDIEDSATVQVDMQGLQQHLLTTQFVLEHSDNVEQQMRTADTWCAGIMQYVTVSE